MNKNTKIALYSIAGVAVAGGLTLALVKSAGAAPPEGGGGGGGGVDQFYVPPNLNVESTPNGDGTLTVTMSTTITNKGDAPGTHQFYWGSNEFDPDFSEEASRLITLQPGESHYWEWTWPEIPDFYDGYFTVRLYGEWEGDNYAEGRL